MRSSIIALLLAGCASPAPLLPSRLQSPDPYVLPARVPAGDPYPSKGPGEEWPQVVEVHVPRHPRWTDTRLQAEVASLSSVVQATNDPRTDVTVLTGPQEPTDRVAAYLCDRTRFAEWRVALDVREVRLPADALSFETLTPDDGEAWTVAPAEHATRLLDGPDAVRLASFRAADGDWVQQGVRETEAYLAGVSPRLGASGIVEKNPDLRTATTGTRIRSRGRLAALGRTLLLDWYSITSWTDARAQVRVESETGFTSMAVCLPRVVDEEVAGRFVLREDEALVFVRPAPGARDEVVVTVVGWAAVAGPR